MIAADMTLADHANLASAVARVTAAGCERIHIDIKDGHFVAGLNFSPQTVQALRSHTTGKIDAHLLVERPEQYLDALVAAECDRIILHVEATTDAYTALAKIKAAGLSAGVALNPGTPVSVLHALFPVIDHVLVLTATPSEPSAPFIPTVLSKLHELSMIKQAQALDFTLGVDGGIDTESAAQCAREGATELVVGAPLFTAGEAPAAVVKTLQKAMKGEA